jgi:hypothetical protein
LKRGIGYLICANLVLTIFIGGLVNISPVNAYTTLALDDQLLYSNDYSYISDYNYQVFFEDDLSPMYNSYWDDTHYEYNALEMHSYTIATAYASDYELRHTWTFQDTYRDDYWDYYIYDYPSSGWILSSSNFDNSLYSGGNSMLEYIRHYNPVINLDVLDMFGSMMYQSTTSTSYIVNGISNSYTVDIYTYSVGDSGSNNYSYYDIFYDEYYTITTDYTYYVDNATGFLLEVEYTQEETYWADFDSVYSTSVGTNITRHYNSYYQNSAHFHLEKTTAGLNPVFDANLPGLEWDWVFDYTLKGDSDFVRVYFWLFDVSLMDIDIYFDEVYRDSILGISNGYHYYDVFIGDIPVSYDCHNMKFVITDKSAGSHMATYMLHMCDNRLDWPQINGPIGDAFYELGTSKTYYWTLTDNNFDPNYYEFIFDGTIISSGPWFDGQLLALNALASITVAGDYLVSIFANDTMGHETYRTLMIHASAGDFDPPTITNPPDVYMKPGESKEISWVLTDANPSHFKVTRNGTMLLDQPWALNNFNVNVSLDTLSLGTWVFEIEVWDNNGNYNNDTVIVYVTETGTNPTGTNTITLDAPGVIYALIGFLSIAALSVYVKKRK